MRRRAAARARGARPARVGGDPQRRRPVGVRQLVDELRQQLVELELELELQLHGDADGHPDRHAHLGRHGLDRLDRHVRRDGVDRHERHVEPVEQHADDHDVLGRGHRRDVERQQRRQHRQRRHERVRRDRRARLQRPALGRLQRQEVRELLRPEPGRLLTGGALAGSPIKRPGGAADDPDDVPIREGLPVPDQTHHHAASPAAHLQRLAAAAGHARTPDDLLGELTAALRSLLGDPSVEIADAPGPDGLGLRLPIAVAGTVRHVVVAGHEPGPDELELARVLAAQAAAGLSRLDADRRRATGAAHDRALVRAARALNASLDLQEVLETLAREAAHALEADLSAVFLGADALGLAATACAPGRSPVGAGHHAGEGWDGMQLALGDGAAVRAVELGRPYATEDYARDVGPHPAFRAALAVPMAWNGATKGALSVGWGHERRIGEDDERTLEAIADLATFACHNAETYEQVQRAARTDALTGLLNHGAMQLRLREEIARAGRDGTPLSCGIVDLDDFKRVNDVRGHQAGDELLRGVAAALAQQLRPYDQVARYGGDEFVLLLPGSDEEAATAVAERVRDAIAERTAAESGLELAGACSIGVATWHEGLDADRLLEHADRALLLAKRTGKGRVAVANAAVERELAIVQAQAGSPAAVQALAAAIEERDAYTHEHSAEVVHLARGVAMILGHAADQVERIADAALLHDVGKLAVPPEILHKPGPLDPGEWEVMAEHPIAGERVLLRIPSLVAVAPIVRHEHEHWDGSGYPDGLRGRRIPIGSRVILACHAYQAMITDRPYRPAFTPAQAVEELRRGVGSKFDPEVVDALLDLLGHAPPQVPDRARGVVLPIRRPASPPPRDRRRSL